MEILLKTIPDTKSPAGNSLGPNRLEAVTGAYDALHL